jgi:hypothetical integral membrane protein (TIGR02206 family)
MNFTADFSLFGPIHIVVILITIALSFLTYFQKHLKPQAVQKTSLILSFLLFCQILAFNSWHILHQDFDLTKFLPLHLCSLSAYISTLALILNKSWLYKLQFFWATIPALIALLLPDMGKGENFPSFRFVEFFWSHLLIVVIAFFIIFGGKLQLKYLDIWKYFGVLIVFAFGIVFPINKVLGGNYMYLMSRPTGGQMDFLPQEPFHTFGLLTIFLVVFHLQYWIYKLFVGRIKISITT